MVIMYAIIINNLLKLLQANDLIQGGEMTDKQELIDDTGIIHYPSSLEKGCVRPKATEKKQEDNLFVGSLQ